MKNLLQEFRQAPSHDEACVIESLILRIEQMQSATEDFSETQWREGLARLSPLRLRSSGTLKRGDLENWVCANSFVTDHVQTNPTPEISHIKELNTILTERTSREVLRDKDIYLGPWKAANPSDLEPLLDIFAEEVLGNSEVDSILLKAALAHYWLVSIHPFWDANGRTSVLVADWILCAHGYLPQSFETQLDAIVGHFSERKTRSTPARALLKILKNIERSYQTILEPGEQ